MIAEHEGAGALVILANFVSPLAVDLSEASVLRQWSEQAPRKIWLTRPRDVLVVPVPLGDAFRRYAFERLRIPDGSVTVVTVPDAPHMAMAQALAVHGLLEPLRALVHARPGARLLPTALDEATVALAADLGTPLVAFEAGGPGMETLRTVSDLNTKSGFRALAGRIGMRLPAGRVCTGAEVFPVTCDLLAEHERVVVKPDRSAGGHGLRFVARGEEPAQPPAAPGSRWVVEQYVDHTRAVSAQGHTTAERVAVLFDGEMRMDGGSFAGYSSPLGGLPEATRAELADWTRALGRQLAADGYRGPYSLDAVCATDGTLYALECNVRRTATTTAYAMLTRLRGAGLPAPAWSTGTAHAACALSFDAAVTCLTEAGLDFRPGDGEGVIFYADAPANGTDWRYAAFAADHGRLTEVEVRLTAALGHDDGS
ncbi:peptide ligase PGM1-related protein [Streptomyces sp. NBC_01477]|uniref:preATP grasp domain-containing protein n=1 Tax=Streptomyces sp. NBC_01477 TaxID=2976015 RepID=UPI002E320583|nr:peptide ligase PGM1-related protein [Streptomyces sp. NBC_01477]